MLFGTPAKLPDGRYFLKMSECPVQQINNVPFQHTQTSVTLKISDAYVDIFSEIDEAILAQAKESKVSWFGKEISDDTVLSAYQKSLNPENELSASFITSKGNVLTSCYDSQKNTLQFEDIVDGTPVDVLLELSGLVFTKRVFEPVWKVVQVRVKKSPVKKFPREYLFMDDPDDGGEEEIDL